MRVCNLILTPIIVVIRTIIQVVREVVRTVCEWVSTTIRRIVQVVERVCSFLPWPLSALCNLVTRLIEVVETIWNWVCREVIDRIISFVEALVEYIYYVLKWVCWIIDLPRRGPALLACVLGFRPPRFMRICIKIVTDSEGSPAVSQAQVAGMLRDAAAILRRCNIFLVVDSTELIARQEFLDGTRCDFSGIFSEFFQFFSRRACCCSVATVYFVRSIPDATGCAYPGTDWVTVASGGDGTVMVQEIGHLADMWAHSSDPNNVMTDQPGGTHDQITPFQCCMLRTSRFVTATAGLEVVGGLEVVRRSREMLEEAAESPGDPFERQTRGPRGHVAFPAGARRPSVGGVGPAGGTAHLLWRIGLPMLAIGAAVALHRRTGAPARGAQRAGWFVR
jgi:hypothetical protein